MQFSLARALLLHAHTMNRNRRIASEFSAQLLPISVYDARMPFVRFLSSEVCSAIAAGAEHYYLPQMNTSCAGDNRESGEHNESGRMRSGARGGGGVEGRRDRMERKNYNHELGINNFLERSQRFPSSQFEHRRDDNELQRQRRRPTPSARRLSGAKPN